LAARRHASDRCHRLDEACVKVGAEWECLCRAVDSYGQTIEFMLSAKRDVSAAKRFFKKMVRADRRRLPFTIGADKRASYPEAFAASVKEKVLPSDCKLRCVKYLSNVTEQDRRAIRGRWRAAQCSRSFQAARRAPEGVGALHVLRKGQVKRLDGRDSARQAKFVGRLFRVAA
jgi:IS6 family transposase